MNEENPRTSIEVNGLMLELKNHEQVEDLLKELFYSLLPTDRMRVLATLKEIIIEDLSDGGS